jgi:hypothetical protein
VSKTISEEPQYDEDGGQESWVKEGKMSKTMFSLAERFAAEFESCNFLMVLSWLKQQPENQPVFTIDEVEAVAREALDVEGHPSLCDAWWVQKKAELLKGNV